MNRQIRAHALASGVQHFGIGCDCAPFLCAALKTAYGDVRQRAAALMINRRRSDHGTDVRLCTERRVYFAAWFRGVYRDTTGCRGSFTWFWRRVGRTAPRSVVPASAGWQIINSFTQSSGSSTIRVLAQTVCAELFNRCSKASKRSGWSKCGVVFHPPPVRGGRCACC